MADRVNHAQRVKLQNVAEREIMRYADDHSAWHKHIHNVELDAMQILKCIDMDNNPNTIDYSSRRTGKTAIKELYNVKQLATTSDQELGIVAPREAQSLVNLNYHMEAIRRSPILSSYIAFKSGRRRVSDTYYELCNRSIARSYGIMAQVDGGDLTIASLEEVDDMPAERLYGRFLMMLAGTRRLGAPANAENKPQIRITGVFKGADTLSELVDSGIYHCLPIIDCYLGIEMGIIHAGFIDEMREQLSADEYIRQLLCKNISARNFIWTSWIRSAIHVGIKSKLEIAEPMPGMKYKKRGLISAGYDHLGHGENPNASKSSFVITEQIGNFICINFARTWPPGTDESIIRADLVSYWRYFMPDVAHGDAFGIGMLTALNDDLLAEHLTTIDRRNIGEGESTPSTWGEWAFSPIQFQGMTKHTMATAVASAFSGKHVAMPYTEHLDPGIDSAVDDMRKLQQQLENIKAEATTKAYQSYKMIKASIGDDLFDGLCASIWGLITRGLVQTTTVLSQSKTTREKLLGSNTMRLPSDPITING